MLKFTSSEICPSFVCDFEPFVLKNCIFCIPIVCNLYNPFVIQVGNITYWYIIRDIVVLFVLKKIFLRSKNKKKLAYLLVFYLGPFSRIYVVVLLLWVKIFCSANQPLAWEMQGIFVA